MGAALLPVLAGCGGGGGGGGGGALFLPAAPAEPPAPAPPAPAPPAPAPPAPPSGASRVEGFSLTGPGGRTYPISVYVPASPQGQALPSIYVTDADARYSQNDIRFHDFRHVLERSGKQALLIGIGNTASRGTDYVLPGAVPYHDFLTQQLIPLIESRYRCDPQARMLSGLSLGGLFVVIAFWLELPDELVFSHYLSSDGAFFSEHLNALQAYEGRGLNRLGDRSVSATLNLAHGSVQPNYSHLVQAYRDRMRSFHIQGLHLDSQASEGHHSSMDIPAFALAVEKYLG